MKRTWKSLVALFSVSTLLLGGCSQTMNVSAEDVFHQVMESEETMRSYYGESTMQLYEGDQLTMDFTTKEYVAEDGKRKLVTKDHVTNQETSVLNDGKKVVMYDKEKEEAFEIDMGMDVPGVKSPKEQMKIMMEMVKDSHEYEIVEESKVIDRETYHLKFKAKNEEDLIGDMDLWIDKKTWFILKMTARSGDSRTEMEYTNLDVSPDFEDDTFTLDIPEDVEIGDLMEMLGPDSVTIQQAEEALGQSFLLFPKDEVILSDIKMYDLTEGIGRYEVEVYYQTKEEVPLFSVSVFPTPEDMTITNDENQVRGNSAMFDDTIRSIMWDENGLRYNLMISNPDLKKEEVIPLIEKMILRSEE